MKKLLLLLVLFSTFPILSQELLMDTEDVHSPDVIEPKFNGGGFDKFHHYISKEFDFTKVTKPGQLVFTFTIDVTGEMTNIRIVNFVDLESATEIIRVLKNAPKWESAKRSGKPFSVNVKYPLTFK